MKIVILIISFFLFIHTTFATVCDFSGFKIEKDKVYGVNQCDDNILDVIPFADYKTFSQNKSNYNIASDINYIYNQNFVTSKTDGSEFEKLNKYFFTDKKNIFIKTQELYLYISKYNTNFKIYSVFETNNGGRFLLKVNGELYDINISGGYVSYNGGIHKIKNIKNIKNLEQINSFIFTDGEYFYSSFLMNKGNIDMNFGFDIITADFFASNNTQLFNIQKAGEKLISLRYNDKSKARIKLIYDRLKLTQNPYIGENQGDKYKEFFIKKELLLYYLGKIVNKELK